MLAASANTDFSLLKLLKPPPVGVGLSGWSAQAVTHGSAIVGIHHPNGDLKKISDGHTTRFHLPLGLSGNPGHFIETMWFNGTTEGGSSGSGIWVESDGQWRLVGTLYGGGSACNFPNAPDYYGRFDLTFPLISSFLNGNLSGSSNSRLLNISTNAFVNNAGLIAGFIVQGTTPQQFIILGENAGSLANPTLTLTDFPVTRTIAFNDDWQTHLSAGQVSELLGRTPGTDADSAFVVTLNPGAYLANLQGFNGSVGQGIVAVNDVGGASNDVKVLNISTNGHVDSEGMIAGFIITGNGSKRVVVMGENSGSLADPVLSVTSVDRTVSYGDNNDWQSHPTASEVSSKLREPDGVLDAAFAVTLSPGPYLAILRGRNGGTGQGIVSVTEVSSQP